MNLIRTGDIKDNVNSAIAFGVDGNVTQNISVDDKVDNLFNEWLEEIKALPNIQDMDTLKSDIADIKDNLLSNKASAATKLFFLLPEAIRTTAAALSIYSFFICR